MGSELLNKTRFVGTEQAAAYLGYSPRFMEALRRTGGGPPFVAAGRRRTYDLTDLDAWAAAHKRRSTSDIQAAA